MANWVICLPVLVVRLGLGELVGLRFRIVEQCFFFWWWCRGIEWRFNELFDGYVVGESM